MDKETLKRLEESENQRVSAVAALAINADISFEDAEKKLDMMIEECKHPSGLQRHCEAKFNY